MTNDQNHKAEKYFVLQLRQVLAQDEDLISGWCFEHGAEGVTQNLPFRQNPEDYSVETLSEDLISLDVFWSTVPDSEVLEDFRERWPGVVIDLSESEHQDWLAEWKKGFRPFQLTANIFVVPRWLEKPKEAKKVIWMEPGMAFGTGTHETTQIAARLLDEALRSRPQARVLDVGTGTGILAIEARLLGAKSALATDIDPEAVRVAQENLTLNKTDFVEVSGIELSELAEPFDVVVANIIDGVLLLLQSDLKRLVAPGGALILSGIIDERLDSFKSKWKDDDLERLRHEKQNEWNGFLLERPR